MAKLTTDNPHLINEYRARINRVMDHVEAHLDEEFTLEGLAGLAGFSKFHFNRIFHALAGESLFAFIQRVRVERAAARLLNNRSTPVTTIAYDCGFSSSAAFSRCFRNRFGVSATQWRKTEKEFTDVGADRPRAPMEADWRGVEPESVGIRSLGPRTLAYIRHTGPYEGDADLFDRLFERLFRWAVPRGLVEPGVTDCFVFYHDSIEITDSGKLRLSVAVEVPPETRASGEVGLLRLKGGQYACARFALDSTQYGEAWAWVFNRFLPSSGFQPEDGLSYERYPAQDCSKCVDICPVDICVPVKPLE